MDDHETPERDLFEEASARREQRENEALALTAFRGLLEGRREPIVRLLVSGRPIPAWFRIVLAATLGEEARGNPHLPYRLDFRKKGRGAPGKRLPEKFRDLAIWKHVEVRRAEGWSWDAAMRDAAERFCLSVKGVEKTYRGVENADKLSIPLVSRVDEPGADRTDREPEEAVIQPAPGYNPDAIRCQGCDVPSLRRLQPALWRRRARKG